MQLEKNGTTLAASSVIPSTGLWRYSGEVSVWNSGAIDTLDFKLIDYLQNKVSGSDWTNNPSQTLSSVGDVIPAGTTELNATLYPYSFEGVPLEGDIRNVAELTITNHSGHLGTAFGPSPKATYIGVQPPPDCAVPGGCVHTQGYWGNKPGVVWPAGYPLRTDTFIIAGRHISRLWTQPSTQPTAAITFSSPTSSSQPL